VTQKKKIIVVAGARPNFMKIAHLVQRLKKDQSVECLLVHTGQHYDFGLSDVFFRDLRIPKPDIFLNVGSASHAEQTAKIMTSFEGVLLDQRPDLIVVVGDVNSTAACSLTAAKLNVKVAHIESGLRSFDRTMPEEINRIVTDAVASYYFVTEKSGIENLDREGADKKTVFLVGNTMIDPLAAAIKQVDRSKVLMQLDLKPQSYGVLTLHRPTNVDTSESLDSVINILELICHRIPLVYPIHPRARESVRKHRLLERMESLEGLKLIEPLGYIDFIKLVKESKFVLTDSGGIQEETTWLRVPCLTMRDNTERPSTIELGTNKLVGRDQDAIVTAVGQILNGRWKKGRIPKLWDGHATERIIKVISNR